MNIVKDLTDSKPGECGFWITKGITYIECWIKPSFVADPIINTIIADAIFTLGIYSITDREIRIYPFEHHIIEDLLADHNTKQVIDKLVDLFGNYEIIKRGKHYLRWEVK